ncbi:MAG TPA: porin [Thermohalobaculum sp.]|nr:porin [Thermohalobaculum sp.]
MKKVLLSTSAIALVGAFATSASANEWDVDVGGYMEQFVAYSNVDLKLLDDDNGYNGVDVKSDAEIIFVPSITLDNGLQFGANVQLEANTSGDQIDESYMFIEGSFGEVNLGSENSAGYKMTYAAPDVTVVGVNSGSTTAFAPISGTATGVSGSAALTGSDLFRGTLGTTFLENMRNNDAQRITYYTPRFFGFQVGASYARDAQQDSNQQVNVDVLGTVHDIWDVGANYVNSFGDFNVAVSGRYGLANLGKGHAVDDDDDDDFFDRFDDDPEVWAVGANLGYAGFTVGGSYAEQNDAGFMDGRAWDAGVAYETGPWGVSFTYFDGENVDNDAWPVIDRDEELQQWIVGLSYTVAQGVKLGAFGGHIDFKEDDVSDEFGPGFSGNEVEAWFIGTSAAIAF